MPRPLSNDLRERLVRAVSGGLSRNAAAKKFDVSVSAVIKLLQRWSAVGSYLPKQMGGYRKPLLAAHADRLHELMTEQPDMSIAEVQRRLAAAEIRVGQSAISRFLRQLGYTYKKTVHAAEQDRPDVKLARAIWRAGQPALDPERLVFVDETGAATNMARRYGRSLRGTRLLCKVPWGHWKTTTLTAALRCSGLAAPMVLDGPMTGEAFLAYTTQVLVPTLTPGDIVNLDNLACHKVAGVTQAIEAAGAMVCYLPAYSPDLNPIEQAFAKIKALLRQAAARTVEDLWQAIADILRAFSAVECAAYLRHAGYSN